jgi:adenylate cyclase
MDSIDWPEIHHFEMALYRPLFKGIKQKRDTHTLNFDATLFKRAAELAKKAVALDDTQPNVHASLGGIHLFQRQYEESIAEGERAIALGPNDATSHVLLAHTMFYAGRFEEAITLAMKAMRLTPYYPAWYLSILAQSYEMAGRYEEALAAYKQLLDRSRKGEAPALWSHTGLVVLYMELGRQEDARAHAAEVMRINPNFSLEIWRKTVSLKTRPTWNAFSMPCARLG